MLCNKFVKRGIEIKLTIPHRNSEMQSDFTESGRQTTHNCFWYGSQIDIVGLFKYLGISLYKNGNWGSTCNQIAQHALSVLHQIFVTLNNIELPTSQTIKLFSSALNYAAQECRDVFVLFCFAFFVGKMRFCLSFQAYRILKTKAKQKTQENRTKNRTKTQNQNKRKRNNKAMQQQ